MVCDRDEQGTVSVRMVACCDRHEKGGETSMMFSTSSHSDVLLPEMKVKNTNKKNKKNEIFYARNNRFSVVGNR